MPKQPNDNSVPEIATDAKLKEAHGFDWFKTWYPPPSIKMGLLMSKQEWATKEKTVLITGASSGIGAELARNFAKQGASFCLLARNKDTLKAVAKECMELGAPKAEVLPYVLTKDSEIKACIGLAVERLGQLDVLIPHAGRSM